MNGDVIVLYRVMRDDDIIFATSSKSLRANAESTSVRRGDQKPRKVAFLFPQAPQSWFRTSPSARSTSADTRNDDAIRRTCAMRTFRPD